MTTAADFLSEGAKSYIDALAAVDAFERSARSVCRKVYEKYKTQLASTMGLENEGCEDHENKDPTNRFAAIGVFQNSPSGRESLYVYVMWDGAPEIAACVSLEVGGHVHSSYYAMPALLRLSPYSQPADDPAPSPHGRDVSS